MFTYTFGATHVPLTQSGSQTARLKNCLKQRD